MNNSTIYVTQSQVDDDGNLSVRLPRFAGKTVEITVRLEIGDTERNPKQCDMLGYSGFIRTVLAKDSEDIWNDL